MRPQLKVALFAVVVALVLGGGWAVGRAVGPLDVEAGNHGADAGHGGDHGSDGVPAGATGLETSAAGYTLRLADDQARAGRQPLRFTVTDADGEPVTAYDVRHEKLLHLIVVRRDLTGFQHVHPTLDEATGEWTVDVDLTPGAWRVVADFTPDGGEPLVLGTDLLVAGDFRPEPLGSQELAARVDGYDVTLGGALAAGAETDLVLTVSRDGEPVTDLQPYLGSAGHLVVLRAGDLGYLHVHPAEVEAGAAVGPTVEFRTTLPTPGRYRLFLDFQHQDVVRTAAFTVEVDAAAHDHGSHDHGADQPEDSPAEDDEQEDGHEH